MKAPWQRDEDRSGNTPAGVISDRDLTDVTRSEEELHIGVEDVAVGKVRARKVVDTDHVEEIVPRDTEYAEVEREAAEPTTDSGQVETLPDGSLSIPVFEEQLVIEKRLVVRERVIIRKYRVTEEQRVEADLRRERVEVEVDDAVRDRLAPD